MEILEHFNISYIANYDNLLYELNRLIENYKTILIFKVINNGKTIATMQYDSQVNSFVVYKFIKKYESIVQKIDVYKKI